ncbi:GH1 family beta-glucosidase [Naasia lichenicola]|uniref:GH1 family beta-glucosidase n=1 Tax=Naasia lichenicola TaxID=2565933 RepID=UPI001E3E7517|nr:GH1 family beta-glucosidase [Naasia lichenicola]
MTATGTPTALGAPPLAAPLITPHDDPSRPISLLDPSDAVRLELLPRDFVWGVATAAYQIEGAHDRGGRGPSIWDTFSHTPGRSLHGDTADVACEHYDRWEADLDLMAELGYPAHRFSFGWSRLQPGGRGPLNPVAVAFYRTLIVGMHARGITPWVTLYHWDLPQELEDAGGWPARETAVAFAEYAALVVAEFRDLVTDWITMNEPWCSSFLGYARGAHAPGRTDIGAAVAAGHHLNLAHGLALQRIRSLDASLQVGITNLIQEFVPASESEADRAAADRTDAACNGFFLDPVFTSRYSSAVHDVFDEHGLASVIQEGDLELIGAPTDFAGVNHYQRILVSADPDGGYLQAVERAAAPADTSFGWSVLPESLSNVLKRVARECTSLPIYVTESGASYADYVTPDGEVHDPERVAYFGGYLDAVAQAIEEGVDVRGYFAWSFMDNFEWAEGYSKRFGLVWVDFATQQRIPKLSGRWYGSLIRAHAALPGNGSLAEG